MYLENCLLIVATLSAVKCQDDDYNIQHRDGSFQFGYNAPDSYHHAVGNRNNVVRGQFGGRNPGTGRIDSTEYTAGPRGYRPRGKNIHRKYDLSQSGPRPIGSKDDPYFDPYEDPSYQFEFKTRTYNRKEGANRFGDVTGRYNYVDDVGEIHNVEYIAGKNTGFHVKTPFPDSNPRAYGRLFFRGRGKPLPRGRTSIQRGLDGSYRFVSAGPDQRRTETSDASGHVRGSYTYLDDKGVQHSVHYIAGPETGYRVLKNVKGPHLPSVHPFGSPDIIPSDFYDYSKDELFDTAASGPIRPIGGGAGSRPTKPDNFDSSTDSLPDSAGSGTKPSAGSQPPFDKPPSGGNLDGDDYGDDFEGELFGPFGGVPKPRPQPARPQPPKPRPPPDDGSYKPGDDDGSYIPPGDANQDDGSYKPGPDESGLGETPKPGGIGKPPRPDYSDYDNGVFDSDTNVRPPYNKPKPPVLQVQGGGGASGGPACERCQGTIVTNVGDRLFSVPPGVSVRAHVQSIDLLPLASKVPSPSEQFQQDMTLKREQLNSAASDVISNNSTVDETSTDRVTTTVDSTTLADEITTINE